MKTRRKPGPDSPAKSTNPLPQRKRFSLMIPHNEPTRTGVMVLFDLRKPEQVSAFNALGAAFPKPPTIEPVLDKVWAVHIRPGLREGQGAA